jgi:hypothetical protein
VSAAQSPVFVDDTGRRRILTRRAGRIVVIGFTGYLGLVALGFARDPQVGPVHLPTFGLPSLGLMVPPAPPLLGEQATGHDDQAERKATPAGGGGPASLRPTTPPGSTPTASAPTGRPAPDKTTPTTGVPASSTNSTVPTTSSTTSSTTTSTTSPGPGQGQGQGSGSASTKGPDGSGPPGQLRKTTTTTAG